MIIDHPLGCSPFSAEFFPTPKLFYSLISFRILLETISKKTNPSNPNSFSSLRPVGHLRPGFHRGAAQPGGLLQHDGHGDRLPVEGHAHAQDHLGQGRRVHRQGCAGVETGGFVKGE